MKFIDRLILKNFIWRIIYFVSVFILNVFIARYFLATGSGWIYYIISLFSFALLFLGFCLETAMGYYLANGTISPAKLASFSLAWVLVIAILCFLMMEFFLKGDFEGIPRLTFIFVALVYIAGNLLITFFSALFYASKNFVTPSLVLTIVNIVVILLIPKERFVGTAPIFDNYIAKIYFSSFLLQGIILLVLFFASQVRPLSLRLPSFYDSKLLIKYSLLAVITTVISFLLFRVDYWFVNKFCSAQELGNYIQTSKLAQIMIL